MMKNILVTLLIGFIFAGCSHQPNYSYEGKSDDSKIEFTSDFDSYTYFYLRHKDIPQSQLAAALQTSIIKGATVTQSSVDVPKNAIILLTANYQNRDGGSLSSPTEKCGPLKALFLTQPNTTYLVKMNFINNNKDKGFWDKKSRNQCFISIIDEKTQKSVLIQKKSE